MHLWDTNKAPILAILFFYLQMHTICVPSQTVKPHTHFYRKKRAVPHGGHESGGQQGREPRRTRRQLSKRAWQHSDSSQSPRGRFAERLSRRTGQGCARWWPRDRTVILFRQRHHRYDGREQGHSSWLLLATQTEPVRGKRRRRPRAGAFDPRRKRRRRRRRQPVEEQRRRRTSLPAEEQQRTGTWR